MKTNIDYIIASLVDEILGDNESLEGIKRTEEIEKTGMGLAKKFLTEIISESDKLNLGAVEFTAPIICTMVDMMDGAVSSTTDLKPGIYKQLIIDLLVED